MNVPRRGEEQDEIDPQSGESERDRRHAHNRAEPDRDLSERDREAGRQRRHRDDPQQPPER